MTQSRSAPRRQGVILLLVVIMLALFLVVGLSFMLYAESEATASRIYREAFTVNYDRADIDTGALLNYALGQLIYDVKDDIDGCDSSMRGHSLARNMYGWQDPATTAFALVNRNTVAFNGIGRLPTSAFNPNPPVLGAADAISLINYRFFQTDGFVRDPERLGFRANPLVPITQATQPYGGGWNVPYTFPDRNNVYLGAIKADYAGSPRVTVPSFHRPEGTPFDLTPAQLASDDATANPWLIPSTANPALKYMVMRPRPADMYWNGSSDPHSFPKPASITGDVQNLPGGAGGNDSYWMDLGYPVQTTRGGTKFKPLFAFLIVDLDGRVNVNVHGNQRGNNSGTPTHVSNQGVGKWEVNLGKVINIDPNELKSIFGDPATPTVIGRYGPNHVVGGSGATPATSYPDPYATTNPTRLLPPSMMRVDFDGVDGINNTATSRLTIPGAHQTQPAFGAGYDSFMDLTIAGAGVSNPFNYNILSANPPNLSIRQNNDDKPFDLNQNLYYVIGDALSQNQQRAALYTGGLRNNLNSARVRHMLTTMSFDLDTPGARPWVTNPQDLATAYTLPTPTNPNDPTQYHAQGSTTGYPASTSTPPSLINTTGTPGSDFLPNDGRCRILSRLDLNRKLAPYPIDAASYVNPGPPPPAGTVPDVSQLFYRAVWERQKFAAEIFDRLVQATGAVPYNAAITPTPEQTNARRYLAQLAANIVDYIDDDECSTPFYWDAYDPNAVVYGVEAPKLVLNEVYAEIRNDKQDDGQPNSSHDFQLHFWVELFNPRMKAMQQDNTTPLMDPIYPADNRADVQLMNFQNSPVYRIRVMEEAGTFVPTDLRALNNVTGDSTAATPVNGLTEKCIAKQWDQTVSTTPLPPNERTRVRAIDPMSPNFPNGVAGVPGTSPGSNTNGYYVVASQNDVEALTPAQEPSNRLQADEVNRLGLSRAVTNGTTVPPQPNHTVLLQRLACPHLRYNPPAPDPEHNPDPNVPLNPYITVDYITNLKTYDAVKVVQFPATRQPGDGDPAASRRSRAREQPLSAVRAATGGQQYSFFNTNSTTGQFDWLVHLDRPPISTMELLQVSAFKPHEITQTFTDSTGASKFQHVAPWLQLGNRLFRGLEYFTVGDRSAWAPFPGQVPTVQPSVGGRVSGRINLNTIWDKEILEAQTDPQQTNFFTQSEVEKSWNAIMQRRVAALTGTGTANSPFMSFANPAQTGQPNEFPTRSGLDGTVLASGVFPGPGSQTHPYLKNEMLTKMANSMTTRSNVFAVYLTVGFFEVLDDTTRPVKLGAEVRPRSGVPIRHKMFAIVDRTHLATLGTAVDLGGGNIVASAGPAQGGTEGGVRKSQFFVTADQVDTQIAPFASVHGVTAEILGQPVNVTVVGGLSATTMVYDGKAIPMPASFKMYADVGENQEVLTDCSINTATGQLFVPNGFRKTHPANFTLSFLLPSNPGPQTNGIDYADPKYSGVIPQAVIIQ